MVINWQDVVTTVGTSVGGGAVLLSDAAWLVKTVLTDRLTRDAEAFKTRLKADADTEIEHLKSSLQMIAVEHQVRFSKLHERRAEVIAELYERLVGAFWVGQRFVLTGASPSEWDGERFVLTGGSPDEQRRRDEYNKTMERIGEFALFVDTHRIYLPDGICALLDKFVDDLRRTVIPVGVYGAIACPNEETQRQRNEAVMSAYLAFEKSIPAARGALETEFRAILGEPQDKHPGNPARNETHPRHESPS
jgi:hypothetical protein